MAVPWSPLFSKHNIIVLLNFCFVSLAELSWHPACILPDSYLPELLQVISPRLCYSVLVLLSLLLSALLPFTDCSGILCVWLCVWSVLPLAPSSCHPLDSAGVSAVFGHCPDGEGGGKKMDFLVTKEQNLLPHWSQLQFWGCHFSTVWLGNGPAASFHYLILQKCPGKVWKWEKTCWLCSEPDKTDPFLVVAMAFSLLKPHQRLWRECYLNRQLWNPWHPWQPRKHNKGH